jgi:DNA-binding XRE family transcriptional regulator
MDSAAKSLTLYGLLVCAMAGCAIPPPVQQTAPPTRGWILWGVRQAYMSDPEVLSPLETFATKRECEAYEDAVTRAMTAKFDKLERENDQRGAEGGRLVRELREKRGLSQTELAHLADTTPALVAKVEAGSSYQLSLLNYKLAKALGTNPSELTKYDMHFPTNITVKTKCWPDTIDPRGPKGN